MNISFQKIVLNLAIVAIAIGISHSVNAQTVATSPCDVKYYETLQSRAWLEAQREITQNQNLIFKPDSVLEYTCFDKYLQVLSRAAPNMFSETSRWSGAPTDMATALDNLVATPSASYLSSNFNHNYLGGRDSSNYSFGTASAGSYTCTTMNDVWLAAKCMDFIDDDTEDGFFTFEKYETDTDKRHLPTACGGSVPWQTNRDKVGNDETLTPWVEDKALTYLDPFKSDNCADPANPPIKTGITVTRVGTPSVFEEKVCLSPGCYYEPTNVTAGTCKKSEDLH